MPKRKTPEPEPGPKARAPRQRKPKATADAMPPVPARKVRKPFIPDVQSPRGPNYRNHATESRYPRGHQWALSGDWMAPFLYCLARNGNVTAALDKCKIHRQTAYKRRDEDPVFAAEWDEAIARSNDALLEEIWVRAVEGDVVDIVYQGQVTGTTTRKSDFLLSQLAKARLREWKDIDKASVTQMTGVQVNPVAAELRAFLDRGRTPIITVEEIEPPRALHDGQIDDGDEGPTD